MKILKYGIYPYFFNMALDEWLMGKGEFLRFYGWNTPTLSYGRNQRISSLNLDYCRKEGFSYVRRPTGGRAVFHEFELTYSFIAYKENFPDSIYETYKLISQPILSSLKKIGLNAEFHRLKMAKTYRTSSCFDSPNLYEIAVNGKKIVGSAQLRRNDSILQHGSILFAWDKEHWVLSHSNSNYEFVKEELENSMTTLNENGIDITPEEFSIILEAEFSKFFSVDKAILSTNFNDDQFYKLIDKYKSDTWNLIK
jgi:lipoate-protein ligase A